MSDSIIQIKDVNKWFGDFQVLKDINLEVKPKEKIVVCGPSGSGKSTLIRCINRLEEHQKGNIIVDGTEISEDTKNIEQVRAEVGMVFQQFNLFPHLSILDNCTLAPIWVKKMPKREAEELALKHLERVQILDQAQKFPGQLSGGQQQRVAVARSLVFDPKLVLMDEPLGALDKNLRESMQYEIKHIHESIGVTVVYVTHDQTEALTMSNRIAVFNDGKVQQLSSPDELYERPVNSFVAEFIGENNTFAGEVTDVSGDKCKVKLNSGAEILANPIVAKTKGQKTTVSLRPERALIDSETKMDNNHKGKIEEVIYHGDHTRLRVNLLGNDQFILKVPNSSSRMDIKEGREVNIGWNSVDCRALDPK